jgi:hypothetical protein
MRIHTSPVRRTYTGEEAERFRLYDLSHVDYVYAGAGEKTAGTEMNDGECAGNL